MLAKSQAKWFFIGGSTLFSLTFLALTADSMAQIPARSHEEQLSPSVIRGKEIWEKNNCMGCHTLLGEGAYYAPELTRVVERRGEGWMRVFLRDPEAMYPGQRRMVNYKLTEPQIDDLIAFFGWVGKIDTNGFPPTPNIVLPQAAKPVSSAASARLAGAPKMWGSVCAACHAVDGQGGKVGPALDDVAARFTPEKLDAWLANPAAVKPGTTMPNLNLTPEVRGELSRWLLAPGNGGAP